MPFDAMTPAVDAATDLFMDRRRRAAELWRGVPAERWDMGWYECGTTACALGWLAHWQHDGWEWGFGMPTVGPVFSPAIAAASYFGIGIDAADKMFCNGKSRATPADVADALLRLPVVGAP